MRRVFSLFLALMIVMQSIIAVGEEQIPVLAMQDSEQDFVLNPQGEDSGSGEAFVGEGGSAEDFTLAGKEALTEGSGESFEDSLYQGMNAESKKEKEKNTSDPEQDLTSPSYLEANQIKSFKYEDEEITVNATLSVPESLPKGVVFLVRPIKEEERPEQYSAYAEALTEHEEDLQAGDLRLYDIGFFLTEEKTGEYEEIEPNRGTVDLKFSFRKPLEGKGELQATHLPLKKEKKEDGISTLDILDVKKEDIEVEALSVKEGKKYLGDKRDKLEFSLDSFSVVSFYRAGTTGEERIRNDVSFSLKNLTGRLSGETTDSDFTATEAGGKTNWKINKSYNPLNLDTVEMSLYFEVKKNRSIKNGDTIRIPFPELLQAVHVNPSPTDPSIADSGVYNKDGKKVFQYEVKKVSNHYELQLQFTEGIEDENIRDILKNIPLKFRLNPDKIKAEGETSVEINIPGKTHVMQFPAIPELISGVKKTAENLQKEGKIRWTIEVGTESKGAKLNGLTVTDIFDENRLKFLDAEWQNPATSSNINIKEAIEESKNTNGTYSFTFPKEGEPIRAPQKIIFTTGLTKNVYKNPQNVEQNTVELSHEDPSRLVSDPTKTHTKAVADMSVKKVELKKEGGQTEGKYISWQMDFNTNRAYAHKVAVVDSLSSGLIVDEEQGIKIESLNGPKKIVVLKQGNQAHNISGGGVDGHASTVDYVISPSNIGGGNELRVNFGTGFDQAYRISFRTKVEEGAETTSATGAQVKNTAHVEVEYPLSDGGATGVTQLPSIANVPFHKAFIKKTAGGWNKTSALMGWSLDVSTRGDDYDKAVVTDNITGDSALADLSISYKDTVILRDEPVANFDSADKTDTIVSGGVSLANLTVRYRPSATPNTAGGVLQITAEKLGASVPLDLSKLKISYHTKALHYIGHNKEAHEYKNKATLAIYQGTLLRHEMQSEEVKQSHSNDLLRKEIKTFYDDQEQRAYFHFTINANNDEYKGLENVVLTDDLSTIFKFRKKDGTGATALSAEYFTITDASDPKYPTKAVIHKAGGEQKLSASELTIDDTHKLVKVALNQPLENRLELDVYAYLNEEGRKRLYQFSGTDSLQDMEIYAGNTAKLESTTFPTSQVSNPSNNTAVTVTAEGHANTENLWNEILKKTGKQGEEAGKKTNVVNWTVKINPLGAKLSGSCILRDEIQDKTFLDMDSVQLYEVGHVSGTAKLPDTPEGLTPLPKGTGVWKAERKRSYTNASREAYTTALEITLPENTDKSYILTYRTYIKMVKGESAITRAENTITDKGQSKSIAVVDLNKNMDWSSSSSKVQFNMKKVDSLSAKLPLAKARYGLFLKDDLSELNTALAASDDEKVLGLAEDIQDTDDKGEISLAGDRNKEYYIMELRAPAGYSLDKTQYGTYRINTGEKYFKDIYPLTRNILGIEEKKGELFTDERERKTYKTGELTIQKHFEEHARSFTPRYIGKNQGNRNNYTAVFKLSIFPKKNDNAEKRVLKLKKLSEGEYQYADLNAADTVEELQTAPSVNGVANLRFKDLPWGKYELEEIKTEEGYTLSSKIQFEVKDNQGAGENQADVIYNGATITAPIAMQNYPSKFSFEKWNENNSVNLKEGEFRLRGKKEDFLKGDGAANYTLVEDGENAYITIDQNNLMGDGFSLEGVLKADGKTKYVIEEMSAPKGYEIGAKGGFSLKADGSGIVAAGPENLGNFEVAGNTLKMKNQPTSFSFDEKDQNDYAVLDTDFVIYPAKETGERVNPTTPPFTAWRNQTQNSNTVKKLEADGYYRLERRQQSILYVQSKNNQGEASDYVLFKVSHDGKSMEKVKERGLSGTVSANKKTLTIRATRVLAHATLQKLDALPTTEGGTDFKALAGAEFTLYQVKKSDQRLNAEGLEAVENKLSAILDYFNFLNRPDKDAKALGVYTTDQDGKITTKKTAKDEVKVYGSKSLTEGLPVGVYYFAETKEPTGYTLQKEGAQKKKYVFVVRNADQGQELKAQSLSSRLAVEDGETATEEEGIAKNDRIPGTLKLIKVDSHDATKKLSGAKYGLYTDGASGKVAVKRGVVDYTATTNGSGELEFSGLDWYKNYYIKELQEPSGYLIDDDFYGKSHENKPFKFSATSLSVTTQQENSKNGIQISMFGIDPLLSYAPEDKKIENWENKEAIKAYSFIISGNFRDGSTEKTYTTGNSGTESGAVLISGDLLAGQIYTIKEGTMLPSSLRPMKDLQFKINNKNRIELIDPDETIISHVDRNYLDLARERTALQFSARVEHQERVGKTEVLPLYGISYLLSEDSAGLQAIPANLKLTVNGDRVNTPTAFTTYKIDSAVQTGEIRAAKRNGYRPYAEGSLSIFGLERGKSYYLRASASNLAEDPDSRKNLDLSPDGIGLYKITVASDSNITVEKEEDGAKESFSPGEEPVFTYGLKKDKISFHTTDFKTRTKDVGEQKYALYMKKDWSLKDLLKGEKGEEDSIEKGTEYRERVPKTVISYHGEDYLLQEVFENDADGNLAIENLTLAQDYLLLNLSEEREYENPSMETAFRIVEETDGSRTMQVLSYGRDLRNPTRPRYQTAFSKGEELYIRRTKRDLQTDLYYPMNEEGVLGEGEEIAEKLTFQWLLYPRESHGGGSPHVSKTGRIPGKKPNGGEPGVEETQPNNPAVTDDVELIFVGLDKNGNPIYFPKRLLHPEIIRYLQKYGLPHKSSQTPISKKGRILRPKKKKGEIGGGYTRDEIADRLAEVLGSSRTLSQEDLDELNYIGEILGAMRRGQMDIYGRWVATGDRSQLPVYLGMCALSAVLLEEYLRRKKKEKQEA